MSLLKKTEIHNSQHTIFTIVKYDTALRDILDTKLQLENQIKKIYDELLASQSIQILKSLDIEKINIDKNGIRVGNLKNAGIQNIYQVTGMSYEALCSIKGIGESSAYKIFNNARIIKANVEKTVRITISPEDKNLQTTGLIRSLYFLIKNESSIRNADRLYSEYHSRIEQNTKQAQTMTGNLRWIFSSKNKKDSAVASLDTLEKLLNGDFGKTAAATIEKYTAVTGKLRTGTLSERIRISPSMDGETVTAVSCWDDFSRNSAPYYALLESITGREIEQTSGETGLPEELLQSIENYELDLSRLKANLRRYQMFGTKYILHQEKVLLGDEMGLGKTMQAIAAFCHLAAKGHNHFLVVCPLSVLVNWRREIEAQSDLNVIDVYGDNRAMEMTQWSSDGGVAVTTFETLNKIPIPEAVTVDMMVVDEAHYIKNPEAIRTKSVMQAAGKAKRILFMTGTPLENRVEEMSFLIGCLQPEIAEQIKQMKELSEAPQFREAVAPVYLRRVREDVLKELPELIEKEQWCLMNAEELNSYKMSLLEGNFMAVRQVSWQLENISKSGKAQRLLEICEEMRTLNRKIIVFSFFKTVLAKVSQMLGEYCSGVIDGSVPASERQAIIDKFTEDRPGSVLVCQIQAGGVGLNIQAANVVIFCEPQIKPSMETQAIARAYRMGQSQAVIVHRLLMQDSVDERIMDILRQKTELFDNFADESIIGEMDTQINEKQIMDSIIEEEMKRLGLSA